jgi:hypothetical protein
VAIGLADHTIVPDAEPVADGAAAGGLLLLLLEQPAALSDPTTTASPASSQGLAKRLPVPRTDLARTIYAPSLEM